jgi:hypothetical protein
LLRVADAGERVADAGERVADAGEHSGVDHPWNYARCR